MSLLSYILSKFKKNSCPKEIEELHKSCNLLFRSIFNKCRKELGQELIDIMNIKSNAYDSLSQNNSDSCIKEKIVKEILSLTEIYFKLAENYTDSLTSIRTGENIKGSDDMINSLKFKIDEISTLIKSLNLQLSLDSSSSISEENEDLINEALALNNVLKGKKNINL